MRFCEDNYFPGEDSLKLLCYPVIGKTNEVGFISGYYFIIKFFEGCITSKKVVPDFWDL